MKDTHIGHETGDVAFNLENQSLYIYINATTAVRACSVSYTFTVINNNSIL